MDRKQVIFPELEGTNAFSDVTRKSAKFKVVGSNPAGHILFG